MGWAAAQGSKGAIVKNSELAAVIANELIVEKQQREMSAQKLMKSDMVVIIERILNANAFVAKKRRQNAPKPRARDEIFDLLASLDGINLQEVTRHEGSRIAAVKKQILEVMKDATAQEVIDEIKKRWARYCRKYPEKRMQTANALVGHWSEFADADRHDARRTEAERMNIYVEPAGDWRMGVAAVSGAAIEVLLEKQWADISPELRRQALQWLATHGRLSA